MTGGRQGMAGIMAEAVRYPAELQVADEGTFDGFHDPFRIPESVLGKYLDEVLVEGGKTLSARKWRRSSSPSLSSRSRRRVKMGLPQQ